MTTSPEPIRVLHVDDDADLGYLTGQFLESADERFDVATPTSAAEWLKTTP